MSTTKSDLEFWFNEGQEKGTDYMIVVCDSFEYEDYPVYCGAEELNQTINKFDGKNMQRIMEVYDLHADRERQLSMSRVGLDLVAKARDSEEPQTTPRNSTVGYGGWHTVN